MKLREAGDPRLQELFGGGPPHPGVKPVIRLPRSGMPAWGVAVIAVISAILLFVLLESRREAQPQPSVRETGPGPVLFSPEPPPLYIPPAPPPVQPATAPSTPAPPATGSASEPKVAPLPRPAPQPQVIYQPAPVPLPTPAPQQARTSSGSALVIDTTAAPAGSASAAGAAAPPASLPGVSSIWGGRARASAFANRSDTVAQGALIPAVLETAFDSTSAGMARAIVSRDVRGFDGTKILIPRGSRLIGEFGADVASGQKRALITWTRLVRPDGMTIALDSPATDPVGRAGVAAHVNSHFFERFLGAILRTSVDLGSAVATRAAAGSVIIAAPGVLQNSTSSVQSNRVVPTLSIAPGTSISVFVARDLEFPSEKQQ